MEPKPPPKGRDTLLTIVLVVLLGCSFAFFLDMVSLGYFRFVIVTVVGITLIGFFHYLLWGYALSREVAGEREEEELKNRLERDETRFFDNEKY